MQHEDLVFVGVCDWGGVVRGKGFPVADAESRLVRGVGVTEAYVTTPCFGTPAKSPRPDEDLVLLPDPAARVVVEFDDATAERFYLGDVFLPDGTPWEGCPRDFLKRAIAALEAHGLSLHASFAQEFICTGSNDLAGAPYSLDAFRQQGLFGEALIGALASAGLRADGFRPGATARQFAVSVAAEPALRAADAAVILREMARGVAWRFRQRAIFAPMVAPDGTGNETNIHLNLWEKIQPIAYDSGRPFGISERAAPFVAGILAHAGAIAAFSAPSVASYVRFAKRHAPALRVDRGIQDQGAPIRPAPAATTHDSPERQFNLAFRAADATCCPHLALGALIWAGVDGLERGLALEASDFAALPPANLEAALAALEADDAAKTWWSKQAMAAYLAFKRAENKAFEGCDDATICSRYAEVR